MLPHAVAYNASAAPEAMSRIARALGSKDAAQGLYDLEMQLGTPRALREIGMPEPGIEEAVNLAVQNPYYNPRPVTREGIAQLLRAAFRGERPVLA